jgi:radical SAM protein with 4Fe4S-binding SPASM domain
MIGLTKLLCGKATVSEALQAQGWRRPHLLQFSSSAGPMVVWNVTARCNLRCVHCYAEGPVEGNELSPAEGRGLIDDLAALGVPVLLFSGGEPLLREDIFDLIAHARRRGLRPSLSSNGTLIDAETARRLAEVGAAYVGVSLDGREETHDRFRAERGAFARALAGLRAARDAGLRTGIRFTLTRDNMSDLPELLALAERERIPRFCLYHLVYAGRGRTLSVRDLLAGERRRVIGDLIEVTLDWCRRGVEIEVLTTDNHADGVLVLRYLEEHRSERVGEVRELLRLAGGCSAGRKFAQVDPWGNVHPCQFWPEVTMGNVREQPFSEIWRASHNETVARLRRMPATLVGERCGRCVYREYCGGCRVRALSRGDEWGDDPSCPLSEEEVLAPAPAR